MKKKRHLAMLIFALTIIANSAFVYAKTDSATRSFTDKGTNVSGKANVSISTCTAGFNKMKSNGSISGSGIWMISSKYYCTKVNVKTCYNTDSYNMYNGRLSGSASRTGYCMWQATMKIYYNGSEKCGWTVCCS